MQWVNSSAPPGLWCPVCAAVRLAPVAPYRAASEEAVNYFSWRYGGLNGVELYEVERKALTKTILGRLINSLRI